MKLFQFLLSEIAEAPKNPVQSQEPVFLASKPLAHLTKQAIFPEVLDAGKRG